MNRHTEALMGAMARWSFCFEAHAAVMDRVLAGHEDEERETSREELVTLDAAADAADALDEALSAWVAVGAVDGFEGFSALVPFASAWVASERDCDSTHEQREKAFKRLVEEARRLAEKVAAVN